MKKKYSLKLSRLKSEITISVTSDCDAFTETSIHRDLKSDSNKRFPNRNFACWAYILDYGESKKGCLSYFCNRSAQRTHIIVLLQNILVIGQCIANILYNEQIQYYKECIFLSELYLLILNRLDLQFIFQVRSDRTFK